MSPPPFFPFLSYRAIGLPCGIVLFLLVKREVDRSRLQQLRARQHMQRATEGHYESERYRRA